MVEYEYGVISFGSSHSAICSEKYLRERFPIQMMPTPRSISATCGISIRLAVSDIAGAAEALRELNMQPFEYAVYGIMRDKTAVELSRE